MNRAAVLAELGLGPIWKLRRAPPVDGGRAPSADAAAPDRVSTIAGMDWSGLAATVADCKACGLCVSRKSTVFGVGNREAAWMIVGEAPGAEEDERGEPFVGQAGRLLDAMLGALALKRERDVYIANVLKCRPPGNRNPSPGEVTQCAPYLTRQLALVKPRLLILMGRFAAQTLLESEASIASMRGRVHQVGAIPAIVTYHPAYLLRTPLDKARAWEDLLFARGVDRRLQSGLAASI